MQTSSRGVQPFPMPTASNLPVAVLLAVPAGSVTSSRSGDRTPAIRPPEDRRPRRASRRRCQPRRIREASSAVARMYEEFSALGPFEKHVIDTSVMSAEETAEVVRGLVATGQMRVSRG